MFGDLKQPADRRDATGAGANLRPDPPERLRRRLPKSSASWIPGVRIGDSASHDALQPGGFFPRNPRALSAWRHRTPSRTCPTPKFMPGATIYVKFDQNDMSQVAIDHAPGGGGGHRAAQFKCAFLRRNNRLLRPGQSACSYCGSPLKVRLFFPGAGKAANERYNIFGRQCLNPPRRIIHEYSRSFPLYLRSAHKQKAVFNIHISGHHPANARRGPATRANDLFGCRRHVPG